MASSVVALATDGTWTRELTIGELVIRRLSPRPVQGILVLGWQPGMVAAIGAAAFERPAVLAGTEKSRHHHLPSVRRITQISMKR